MKVSASKEYALLAVLLLWALIAQGVYSGSVIFDETRANQQARLPVSFHDYSMVVDRAPPGERTDEIWPGDELMVLDGKPVMGEASILEAEQRHQPGSTLMAVVKRKYAGTEKTLTIPVYLKAHAVPPTFVWTYVIGVLITLPFICLLVGFYIVLARPRDPLAWITMAMLASFGQLAAQSSMISWAIWPPWRQLLLIYHSLLSNTWPLWMLLFALYFPRPSAFLQGRRWIIYAISIVPALLVASDIYGSLMQGHHVAEVKWLYVLHLEARTAIVILFALYVSAFFFCLGIKMGQLKDPDSRRRLRVMLAGCGISLLPTTPVFMAELGFVPMFPPWLAVICLLMLILFPLTIAYVIVVQRAMDVRMVVRSGLQYALAATGVKVLRVVLVIGIALATIHFVQESEHRIEGIAIFATGGIAVILLSRLARWAGQAIDRRFFREAYNAERILTELSTSVAGIRDTKRVMETVVTRIAASLHVPRVAFLLEQGGKFQPAYALGFNGVMPVVQIAEQASTIKTLKRLNSPSRIYFDDPQSWVHGTSESEQTALQRLETQLLLPVSLDNRMMGVISLGSKRSQLPYSKADLQLLGAVAGQTGLALENAQLTESIRKEIAQRERLDRELEIARDVQQRLFPQKLPSVKGLDFAGYCRPAQGVGGDYYDFIHLATGSLGIAVGDVSGKGIAAALMMASLQASLRGQTIKPCDTLSEMIHHINGLVYEASAANRYATFFYAQYDPVTKKLRYVNAGHNPPILRRKKGYGYEFLRLEEGGTVIGLFPDFPFKEAEIELQSGDVLVAFTDGVSEAMNHEEEEFDEQRLLDAIRNCPPGTAATISSHILESVDAFTAGADQSDDMTLVIVRLL